MAKGLFTQGMCILCREPMSIEEIRERLKHFDLIAHQQAVGDVDAPETLIYDYRPDASGTLLVTPSTIPWPDDMGDPDESPERFVAWSLGQFGPLAFPGCLQRATERHVAGQTDGPDGSIPAANLTDRSAEDSDAEDSDVDAEPPIDPQKHTAHVRLLISYVLGVEDGDCEDGDDDSASNPPPYVDSYDAGDDDGESFGQMLADLNDDDADPDAAEDEIERLFAGDHDAASEVDDSDLDDLDDDGESVPLVPPDYDPVGELQFLMRAVTTLMQSPVAIAYFNPGGEVLQSPDRLRRGLNDAWRREAPPLSMWTGVRIYRGTDDWLIMDTVGNGQFDRPDMEAVYREGSYESESVERFIRGATLYLLSGSGDVATGDTAEGPGGDSWRAVECDDSLSDPPRPVIRWFPENEGDVPEDLLQTGAEDSFAQNPDFDDDLDDEATLFDDD